MEDSGKYIICVNINPDSEVHCSAVRSLQCRNIENFRTTNYLGWEEGTASSPQKKWSSG